MVDENKDQVREPESPETESTGPQDEQVGAEKTESDETYTDNEIAEKRGRMVAAGVIATVVLSVIAVVVAGVFQFTAAWFMSCPGDLPVNDPAPILWNDIVTKKEAPPALGVPKDLAKEVSLKVSNAPPK